MSRRRRPFFCLVVLYAIFVCCCYRAVAIPVLRPETGGRDPEVMAVKRAAPSHAATSASGVDESKRRVPSCPDPLHNNVP
ncbi:hypothetical protein OPV22_025587 [Ensete ventricosum]|uniref:Uncharacterized protein n=1 Tax=Ensete ventricosum TaxID=4639 RepID=A0AAV8QJL7_ENSVE|nr:hypothetical protein OPV22_025587 [Ensete ventricosum]